MVGQRACANLRTLAVPLGGCAKACVSFSLARCARGGCKWSETELVLVYVAFPLLRIAKIATWVCSVREDMQATDSSRGPVVRD